MRLQTGFVVLPWPSAKAAAPVAATARRIAVLAPLRGALASVRTFVAGVLVGAGVWTPVFVTMADDPGPWGAWFAPALFAAASVLGRPARELQL